MFKLLIISCAIFTSSSYAETLQAKCVKLDKMNKELCAKAKTSSARTNNGFTTLQLLLKDCAQTTQDLKKLNCEPYLSSGK